MPGGSQGQVHKVNVTRHNFDSFHDARNAARSPMKRILLLTAGLALGLGAGLLYAWGIRPAQYADTNPASLRADYKADYIQLVAQSFVVDGDIDRARARLAALGFDDPGPAVAAAARRFIAAQKPEADLRRLARLAAAFNATTPEMLRYLPTPTSQTPNAP